MALVSGQRSSLNPNAPLFIPTAYRQVEDFSPEWWALVTTSTWFRDFWLIQHPEGSFDSSVGASEDVDVVNLLPENIDLGIDDEFPNLEDQFEEMVLLAEAEEKTESIDTDPKRETPVLNGLKMDAKAILIKDLSVSNSPKEGGPKSPVGPAKYQMRPAHSVSTKCATRRIHQPR